MTKDECRARLTEKMLTGAAYKSELERVQLTTGCCSACGHNLCVIRIRYEGLGGNSKFTPKVISCECGRVRRLFIYSRLIEPCPKCKTLPEPSTRKFKSKHQEEKDGVLAEKVDDVKYEAFACKCGLLQPHRNDRAPIPKALRKTVLIIEQA